MRSSLTSHVVLAGLIVGLAGVYGCSPAEAPPSFGTGGSTGSGGSASGTGGSASGTGGSASGSGGSGGGVEPSGSGGSGTGGSDPGTGGTAGGSGGNPGTGGTTPDGGGVDMGATGTGGAVVPGDIRTVVPTAGCGKAPTGTGNQTIQTMGTKPAGCADSRCGAWSYPRNYILNLPTGYVNTKAYPLIFQGGGCGAGAGNVYPLNAVQGEVIRVGIAPPPTAIGHATNPGQGCFDDKEGDDSVDWVFYENLYDKLADTVCFDKNRVMASGNSSGAWFSNEVGCKYAGADKYSIRAIMPNTGGLPTDPRYVPTCTTKPLAGMWVHEVGDSENPFAGNKVAIARAMMVNKCTPGTNFDNATKEPFVAAGVGANVCKKIVGCPALYPLVVCDLPGNAHGSHDNVTNPGFAAFIKLFSSPAFLP